MDLLVCVPQGNFCSWHQSAGAAVRIAAPLTATSNFPSPVCISVRLLALRLSALVPGNIQ